MSFNFLSPDENASYCEFWPRFEASLDFLPLLLHREKHPSFRASSQRAFSSLKFFSLRLFVALSAYWCWSVIWKWKWENFPISLMCRFSPVIRNFCHSYEHPPFHISLYEWREDNVFFLFSFIFHFLKKNEFS